MCQIFLNREERLYNDVLDISKNLIDIFSLLAHFCPQTRDTAFVAGVVCNALGLFELGVFFI